jgi:hypothetical protein
MNVVAILQLIPAIVVVMKAVEEAIPGTGKSEAKLAAARELLESVDDRVRDAWPKIEKLIAILVALFNREGWKN